MRVPERSFTIEPAVRAAIPLNVGIVGQQGSGKTMSAIRLAVGEQRVVGGSICFIDTEAGRGKAFAPKKGDVANPKGNPPTYDYDYLFFAPPYGPLHYLAAIRAAVAHGARVVIVDSMTHEHYGQGGVMSQIEEYLDQNCRTEHERKKKFAAANVRPKMERRFLNMEIERLGINGIFCYRGKDKLQWGGGEPTDLGLRPETTTDLAYQMTINFLLHSMAEGRPTFTPENEFERDWFKLPIQFRGWFGEGVQLSEEIGERMALWARGDFVSERDSLLSEIKRLSLIVHPDEQPNAKAARAALLREAFGVTKLAEIDRLGEERLKDGRDEIQKRAALLYPIDSRSALDEPPSENSVLERQEIREPFAEPEAKLATHRIKHLTEMAELRLGANWMEVLGGIVERVTGQRDLAACPAIRETDLLRGIKDQEVRLLKEEK